MQLGRQTDVPEIQSYQDESAVLFGGSTSSPYVGRNAPKTFRQVLPEPRSFCSRKNFGLISHRSIVLGDRFNLYDFAFSGLCLQSFSDGRGGTDRNQAQLDCLHP